MNTAINNVHIPTQSISYHFEHEGDSTLIIRFQQHADKQNPNIQVNAVAIDIAEYINCHLTSEKTGIIEAIPTFSTVGVYYDLDTLGEQAYDKICQQIQVVCEHILSTQSLSTSTTTHRVVEIPVCYEFGEDLADIAETLQLSIEDVIALHSNTPVRVFMLGFSPGMPYLGLFDNKLNIPRRATPRIKLPKGSVAIANRQCVIYPFETPGGWHIVGRTPLKLFTPEQAPHTPYQPGDTVIFKPISATEYQEIYQHEHLLDNANEVSPIDIECPSPHDSDTLINSDINTL